jgi:dTDP-4-dehydrorhamnose reductase
MAEQYLVLGSNGILGASISSHLEKTENKVLKITRQNLNIFNQTELRILLSKYPSSVVLNCVAFMPADKCQVEPELSEKVNLSFVDLLAHEILKNKNQKLIQYSTDFVFDGESQIPYLENSPMNPLSVYGQHKKNAEIRAQNILRGRVKIIRLASLTSKTSSQKTFIEKVLENVKSGKEIKVVNDLRISTSTSTIVSKSTIQAFNIKKPVIHAVHSGETTWYDIAQVVFDELNLKTPVQPVNSNQFLSVAPRPRYSVLNPTEEVLALDARNWELATRDYVSQNFKEV